MKEEEQEEEEEEEEPLTEVEGARAGHIGAGSLLTTEGC